MQIKKSVALEDKGHGTRISTVLLILSETSLSLLPSEYPYSPCLASVTTVVA